MVISQRYSFWLSLSFLSLFAAFLSYRYMDTVYPLFNLSITTDRNQVFVEAQKLAQQRGWDVTDYYHVTSFDSEDELQCFVELEAGGKDAFISMFQSGMYYPYHWHVRFFKEKEVVEMHAWFSPQGERLGFQQKLSELTPGAALTKEQAQALVEQEIAAWCPHFENYRLIEYESEKHQTGRIDHDFTYERTDKALGKGFYRFEASVCGDCITKFEPTVKIPDNFVRRYKQMRSANNLVAAVGSFFFRSLYLLFFGLFGLILFYRRNYLLAKSSCIAAAVVAGGMFFRGFNDFPLWWTSYNTVQSISTFVLMKLFEQVIGFIYLFGIIFFTLVVAEAAGRFMYKHHVQFFKIWTPTVIGSLDILQQVVLGYLLVPFMFLYVIVFGYVTKTYFDWWMPASSLSDPNVVASYFPWLGALTISLQAGFFEEVVCRALPLAMTAVLTRESKHKKLWFILMFFVQALIFGACHANYPNQPFYARLVELIIPSFGFGWVYLQFGLLPGVITHFTYDVIWFAMPIFVSNLWMAKGMVIFLAGLPLWIVIAKYFYTKKLYALPEKYFNQAFQALEYVPTPAQPRRIGEEVPPRNSKLLIMFGLCGLLVWGLTNKFQTDTQKLLVTRSQAIEIAEQAVYDKFGVVLDKNWTPVVINQDDCSTTSSRFIWQVYGKNAYNILQGSYLAGVNWYVRFVQFGKSVEDRGEEYGVVVSSCNLDCHKARTPVDCYAGHVIKITHKLPEHFAGAMLSQEHAQKKVYRFIEKEYGLSSHDIQLISVNSDKFDNRLDWTIIVQDKQSFDFDRDGQARIQVKVAGDKITECSRFIFVPEDWTRIDQARVMNLNLVKAGLWFLMFLLLACGAIFGIGRLMVSRLGLQMMRHKALFVGLISIIYTINSFSVFVGTFNTAEPFYDQLTRICLGLITQTSYQVMFCSLFLAIGAVGFIRGRKINLMYAIGLSAAAASIFLGVSSLVHSYEPYLEPVVGNYGPSAHWLPWFAFCAGYLKIFYVILSLLVAMFVVLKTLRNHWPNKLWLQMISVFLFCLSLQALQPASSVSWMLVYGIVMGMVVYGIFYLLLQYDMTLLPLVFGFVVIGRIISELLYPAYVGGFYDACVAIALVASIALFFYERAHQE